MVEKSVKKKKKNNSKKNKSKKIISDTEEDVEIIDNNEIEISENPKKSKHSKKNKNKTNTTKYKSKEFITDTEEDIDEIKIVENPKKPKRSKKTKEKVSSTKFKSKEFITDTEDDIEEITNLDNENENENSEITKKSKRSTKSKKVASKSNESSKKKKLKKKEIIESDKDSSETETNLNTKKRKRKHKEIEDKIDDDEVELIESEEEVYKEKEKKKKNNKGNSKKKKSKKDKEEEEYEDVYEEEDFEIDEEEEKELRKEIKRLKMKSEKDNEMFTDIENDDDLDLDDVADSDSEELNQEESDFIKEGLKFNDWENLTNEEFNEKMKSLTKKRHKALFTNYLLSFKPVLFQLSSHYLSNTNNFLSLIQKFRNTKNSLSNRYNKFSVWPVPLSEQGSVPFYSYDIFTADDNKRQEDIMFKKVLDNDIYFTDSLKEETKAFIGEYWKKLHHQENFEYNELKKLEKRENELLNNDTNTNQDNDNDNDDFTLLSDEKIALIQMEALNNLNKIISQMVTEQSFISRYRTSVTDFIGINNSGNILSQALISKLPLEVIRNTLNRMIKITEKSGGNISMYKKLDEYIKGLEKEKKNEEIDENNEEIENSEDENENEVSAKGISENENDDELNGLKDLKKMLGKYTLQKYGNALKKIKIKKNLEEIINEDNVLNLYTFK